MHSALPDDVTVLEPPTAEMRWWAGALAPTLHRPGLAGTALVTPLAHVAIHSLDFQAWLYAIFHRSRFARAVHAVGLPGVLCALLAYAHAQIGALAWLLTLTLAAWYLRLGLRHHMPAWGLLSAGAGVTLGLGASAWAAALPVAPGWAHPGLAAAAGSLLLALSHVAEDVPPRVTGHSRWMSSRAFFGRRPLRNTLRAAAMVAPGTLNELFGSWRLTPLVLLDAMLAAGYRPARRAHHQALLQRGLQGGQPAIDCIGTGGADAARLAYGPPAHRDVRGSSGASERSPATVPGR